MMRKYCYLYLTCDTSEREKIAETLLQKHLVACAKFLPVMSMYWWEGALEKADETLTVLESATDLYAEVEAEVAKIHSYETFVLTEIPMTNVNSKAIQWLEENLKATTPPSRLA